MTQRSDQAAEYTPQQNFVLISPGPQDFRASTAALSASPEMTRKTEVFMFRSHASCDRTRLEDGLLVAAATAYIIGFMALVEMALGKLAYWAAIGQDIVIMIMHTSTRFVAVIPPTSCAGGPASYQASISNHFLKSPLPSYGGKHELDNDDNAAASAVSPISDMLVVFGITIGNIGFVAGFALLVRWYPL
jgi:hypothetical protein